MLIRPLTTSVFARWTAVVWMKEQMSSYFSLFFLRLKEALPEGSGCNGEPDASFKSALNCA